MICMMHKNAKVILYDGVGKGDVFPIAFRSVQGTITNIINFMAAKWIQIAIVGVVNNLSPVCCVVLCYFMLGETLALKEIIFLALIVVCIFDIVIFAPKATTETTTKSIT
jgi:uncharacterized membrane protein